MSAARGVFSLKDSVPTESSEALSKSFGVFSRPPGY